MSIQWNKVTWYSKLIALILFVALPFLFFYWGTQYGETLNFVNSSAKQLAATSTESVAAYYSDPSEWIMDSNNTQGGFSIAYPLDFDAQDNYSLSPSTDWRLNAGASGIKYFTVIAPRAFEPQTNFVDATLTVGASGNNDAVAQCLAMDPNDGPETTTSTAMINGVTFTVFKFSGAGAGNYYDTTSYRTLHGGQCYAIEYTVHSGQILNYPSSYNLKPFNEAQIDAVMQNVIGTFKFM